MAAVDAAVSAAVGSAFLVPPRPACQVPVGCALHKEDGIVGFLEERSELVDGGFFRPEEKHAHGVLVRGKPFLPFPREGSGPAGGDGILDCRLPTPSLDVEQPPLRGLGNVIMKRKTGEALRPFRHETDAQVGPFAFLLVPKIDVLDDDDRRQVGTKGEKNGSKEGGDQEDPAPQFHE